jgi:hypothetical protein
MVMEREITKTGVRLKELHVVIIAGLVFFYCMMNGLELYEGISVGYFIYILLRFINNLGYTICFFDFLCFYSALDTLLMPLVGYRIYNIDNHIARLWGWLMRVPEDYYFDFMLPANLALFFGVNFFLRKYKTEDYVALIKRLPIYLKDKGQVGIVFTVIGFICTFFTNYVPDILSFIFYLASMLKYVGPLYVYFSDLSYRKKALIFSLIFFLIQAIIKALFGEFVIYTVLATIVLSLQFKLNFYKKLLGFVVGIFMVFILQSVKGDYREIVWMGKNFEGVSAENTSPLEVFGTLFYDRLFDMHVFDEKSLFGIYTRFNQGVLISRAMDYVPRVQPFADGETIIRSFGAIAVPRFLWPDKPQSGGEENLRRFVGIKRRLSYSMNIGPFGEAYGNFGPGIGGITFMFFYGFILSFLLNEVLRRTFKTKPSLIIWTPLLLFYSLTVETDVLSALNSFFKGAIFVAVLFFLAKKFFRVSL